MSGIYTIDDIRDRCVIDDITGCWLWRGAKSGGKHPSLWLAVARRYATMGQAIAFFKTGEFPEKGATVFWHCKCTTKGCSNPDHRMAGTRKTQMRKAKVERTPLTRARMAASKRAKSRLTEDAIEEIRASNDLLRVVAERHGISISFASQIRRGERRAPIAAPGASIFSLGSNLDLRRRAA